MEIYSIIQKTYVSNAYFYLFLKLKKLPRPLIKIIIEEVKKCSYIVKDFIKQLSKRKMSSISKKSANLTDNYLVIYKYVFEFVNQSKVERKFIKNYLELCLRDNSYVNPGILLKIRVPVFSQETMKKFNKNFR